MLLVKTILSLTAWGYNFLDCIVGIGREVSDADFQTFYDKLKQKIEEGLEATKKRRVCNEFVCR